MMTEKRKKISRREFLKLAGLATSSIAAANLDSLVKNNPVSTENSKMMDAAGRPKRPWWIREVETPTVDIDWENLQRFDARATVRGSGIVSYVGEDEFERLTKVAAEKEKERILKNVPGYTLKDQALVSAQANAAVGMRSFLGPQRALTPTEREAPKWKGSSDEAARILRVAMRHFGAATIGFVELNEKNSKLMYSYDMDGKQIAFEDVDEAYETSQKRVIPYKAKWVIVYTVQMSSETLKRAPTAIAQQTTLLSYSRALDIQNKTQEFLRGLGYQCLGEATVNGLGISPAFAVMAGLGELARHNRVITPEFGPMVRIFKMVTDLPVTIDKPIDAGIMEFCKHCKKCSETCPASALSFDDEPGWSVQGKWNNPGHKAWYENSIKCRTYMLGEAGTNCSICFSVCPFSKKNKAWIHQWVKAGISVAPPLDSLLRSLDDAFSYGAQKRPEEWWWLNLPEYGIDTEQTIQED
ncbi:MAG: reductive dehalogenase [Anaerolineae bacterium]|jgi:epoxyqueuosine reductase|nr:reductive dehalogenase [Anaerolineae bacterium]MBT7072493.1 reductive dehalogenase [Anaerolineae bacterium]MBT7325728.1 reductive dehalogenase [Anaerolineae bacterium]